MQRTLQRAQRIPRERDAETRVKLSSMPRRKCR